MNTLNNNALYLQYSKQLLSQSVLPEVNRRRWKAIGAAGPIPRRSVINQVPVASPQHLASFAFFINMSIGAISLLYLICFYLYSLRITVMLVVSTSGGDRSFRRPELRNL